MRLSAYGEGSLSQCWDLVQSTALHGKHGLLVSQRMLQSPVLALAHPVVLAFLHVVSGCLLAAAAAAAGTDHLAPALLTLDTNATLSSSNTTSSQQQHHGHGSSTRLSTPGSAMLATLLTHYSKKAAKPFAASVAALSAADVARAAKDPAGSRALQAFIEGGVAGSAAKSGLLAKLAGCWGDVALQGAGSFFLEKAYAWAVRAMQNRNSCCALWPGVLCVQQRLRFEAVAAEGSAVYTSGFCLLFWK